MFKLNKKYSAYPDLADTEVEWLPADTRKLYKDNCRDEKTKSRMEKEGWLTRKFTYKFNSHGFRCEEFNESAGDSIVFLGCSHTAGIGLPYEDTFAYIVSQDLGLRNYNLGVGAGSNDSAYRIGSYWIPKLKPKVVVLIAPDKNRSEIMAKDGPIPIGAQWEVKFLYDYKKILYSHALNSKFNKEKNILALNQICDRSSIPFVVVDQDELDQLDRARDQAHAGIKSNKQFAEQILPRIKLALEE